MSMMFSEHQLAFYEGKQAEEYRAKKDAEKENKDKKNAEDDLKAQYRNNTGSKPWYKSSDDAKKDIRDKDMYRAARKRAPKDDDGDPDFDKMTGSDRDGRVRKDANRRFNANMAKGKSSNGMTNADMSRAYDASRRNSRRHPTKESYGLFAE